MQKVGFLAVVGILLFVISSPGAATIDPAKEKEIRSKIGVLQIPFIKNESQIKDRRVKYYASTFAGTVFVTDDEIIYALRGENVTANTQVRPGHGGAQQAVPKKDFRKSGLRSFVGAPLAAPSVGANPRIRPEGCIIKEKFLNAKKTEAIGIKEAETKVSYFKGSDQSNWKSNISTYQEIGLGEIYDHIKLNLKAYGKNIEKLFIVEKGGKPEDIAVKVEGAKGLKVNEKGELEVETGLGTIKMTKPVAYQEIEGKRVDVAVNYMLHAQNSMLSSPDPKSRIPDPELRYAFNVAEYNRDYPLIIDPLLASTFIGGTEYDLAHAIAIDSSGNIFIAGGTGHGGSSGGFPTTPGAFDTSYNGGSGGDGGADVFISKFDSSLTTLLASTFIGGSNDESAMALAIDPSGNVFVTGETWGSSDFPTTEGAFDNIPKAIFVSKLNSSLTSLLGSTFIGGTGSDEVRLLAIDTWGNVFIAGDTSSYNYPVTPGAYDTSYGNNYDVFVSKLNNSLTTLLASTFIGGSDIDVADALTIDSSGNVFIGGLTTSSDFPTTQGAFDRSCNNSGSGCYDAFVSKLNNSLNILLASTFIGGGSNQNPYDVIKAIAIDSSGNVFVAGATGCSDFPTTQGAYDTSYNANGDAFISKFNNSLTTLLASTFIGGDGYDLAYTIAIDSSGNVFIAGQTESENYPTTPGAYDRSYKYTYDYNFYSGMISKLNSSLTSLLASTFIGGSKDNNVTALAIDFSGNVFITGYTGSTDYPTTKGAYNTVFNGCCWYDAFVSKLDTNLSEDIILCTFSISPTSQSFSANGVSGNVNVIAARDDCTWTALSNASWITITSTSGGTGNGWVVFWVSANPTTSSRTGTMSIAGETFTVTQEGGEVDCTFSISPTSQSFGSSGGAGSVSVTTQSGCTWTAASNTPWIIITSGSSGTGNGTVNYSVSANTATTQRTGTITIAGQIFTITQEGLTCSFSISPVGQSFDSTGGTGIINITTQTGCTWAATSNDSWVTITSGNNGTGNGTVNYSVSTNTGSERTGTMTIAGETFTVTQEGYQVSECSAWDDVINKYNSYVSGQEGWNEVIACYNQYTS